MKKKLFLSIIPLCLLMSSCSSGNNVQRNEIEEIDTNDDEFLNAEIKCLDPIVTDTGPVIGVQRIAASSSTSIRFVGVIKLTDKNSDGNIDDDDLASSTVRWNLATYTRDGNVRRSAENRTASKVYEAIAANGSRYGIETYNSIHKTSYTHFVTYVIRNIPSIQASGNLLMKLTVDGTTSKIVCSSGDGFTQFSFDESQTGYFAVKKLAEGGFETVLPVSYHTVNCPYVARFEGVERTSSTDRDEYIVVHKENNIFKTLGYNEIKSSAQSGSGEYARYGSTSNFFYSTADGGYDAGHTQGAIIGVTRNDYGTYTLLCKRVAVRRISFKTLQSPQMFSTQYVPAYRLMLEFTATELSKTYTVHYEEADMRLVTLANPNQSIVLSATIYSTSAGTTDTFDLKWWSIRPQYTGYSGWPNDTYYGNGKIALAPTSETVKLHYICTSGGSNPSIPTPGSCNWTTGHEN